MAGIDLISFFPFGEMTKAARQELGLQLPGCSSISKPLTNCILGMGMSCHAQPNICLNPLDSGHCCLTPFCLMSSASLWSTD